MSFNPYTWNDTEPMGSQNISAGQATILENMQFLGSIVGLPGASAIPGSLTPSTGWIEFPNGFIFQWIYLNALSAGNNTIEFSVAGGTAFPTNLFAAWAQSVSNVSTNTIQVNKNSLIPFNNTQLGLDCSAATQAFLFLIGN
jgi:hypothetical protein